ncbi:hypothetical protein Fmac_002272 [Flemingia macrophylla]|uniref:BHLH domain-containing protein n=1 Tax=Flemingia macrophylla TaxID=520843 RepID=A0ABD1NKT8_9FABA
MTTTEESWTSWLCDLESDHYDDANEVEGSFPQEDNLQHSSTMSNFSGDDQNNIFGESPAKTLETGTSNPVHTEFLSQKKASSLSYILSFDNAVNPAPILNIDSTMKPKGKAARNQKKEAPHSDSVCVSRSPHHAKDHIIAERKRREKISQQFIALSALIPGLKKMDKATVLGDAIRHVKELQEQVKVLEEQNKRKRVESVVYVNKSTHEDVSDTSSNSGDGNSYGPSKTNASLPQVEARVSDKHVLIRIHCDKQKGLFMNILKEVENLHLSVTNTSVLLFGTSKLDITIVAEMEEEFRLSVKEVATSLRVGLMQLM